MDFYRKASATLAAIVFFTGLLVLAGWAADIPTLKSIFPGTVSMKSNTALCFVLLGAGLWSLQGGRGDSVVWKTAARVVALMALTIGAITMCEYIFGWDPEIDQILFREPPGAIMTLSPGRMALNTAACFVLLGAALLLASIQSARTKVIAQFLFTITGCIATFPVLTYIYGISSFYIGAGRYTAMAVHTATAFILLAIGGLLGWSKVGFMKIITADDEIGRLARKALWTVNIVVVGTDVLASLGTRLQFYDDMFATALHATVMLAMFYFVIIASAYVSAQEEEGRIKFGTLLDASERRYRDLYNSSSDAIMTLEPGKRFLGANPATLSLFGFKDEADFTAKTFADLSPDHQPDGERSADKSQRMMATAMEKGKHFFEWKHRHADGHEFWATVLLSRVDTGGKPVFQATIRDIDLQKTRVIEMERFHAVTMDREKRIIELKNEIKTLREALEK